MNAIPKPQGNQPALSAALAAVLQADEFTFDTVECRAAASDVYMAGEALAVVRCRDKQRLANAVGKLHELGVAMVPRGGGMSYTGGYVPTNANCVIIDVSALNRIVEINADDLYVTVEAGVTWQALYEALKPLGLRVPFFGTFSGAKATVGGGISNGALFFGTARYGTAADNMLGLEVVLADGSLLRTGQNSLAKNLKPFYRTYGPDLSGLFVHDCGALGIKVQVTLKLIPLPICTGYASFAFVKLADAAAALSAVARSGAVEEAYVFDAASTKKNLESSGVKDDIRTLINVVRNERGLLKGLMEGAQLALGGKKFISGDVYSLHVACTGRNAAALEADLDHCREICAQHSGSEIVNSIPKAARAGLFPAPNGVLGPKGDRWAALNAKVAHSDASKIVAAGDALVANYAARMQACGVWMSFLFIAVGNHSFSYEPVFHWYDEWLPIHERTPTAEYLANFARPAPNPAARALVAEMRSAMAELFAQHGAASNQIGRTYPYLPALRRESQTLLLALKQVVDPKGLVNPGVLGLG